MLLTMNNYFIISNRTYIIDIVTLWEKEEEEK